MSGYLLDTNIASHIIRGDRPEIIGRLTAIPMADIAISSVTEGELLYGLAKRGRPVALAERVRQFLIRVDILDWDRKAAGAYGDLRTQCERLGVPLAPLDMMIAAHAVATAAVLVSRDRAFARLSDDVRVEDWAAGGA